MSESIESIRQTASQLAERMKADPAFKTQVEQNPEATLVAAGLPQKAVPDFLAEAHLGNDVKGYMPCTVTCVVTDGCVITI